MCTIYGETDLIRYAAGIPAEFMGYVCKSVWILQLFIGYAPKIHACKYNLRYEVYVWLHIAYACMIMSKEE